MSRRITLILSLIFSLIQGAFLPPVFAEGVLFLFFLWANEFTHGIITLFVVGIIFDLIQSQNLGTTSFIFTILAGLLIFLKNQIPLNRPLFLSFVAVGANLIREKVVFGTLSFLPEIIVFIICFVLFSTVFRPHSRGIRL